MEKLSMVARKESIAPLATAGAASARLIRSMVWRRVYPAAIEAHSRSTGMRRSMAFTIM